MTVIVSEYSGMAWLRSGASQYPAPQEPALAVTQISSAGSSGSGMSTLTFSSNTRFVLITNTFGNFFALFGSSLLSTTNPAGISSTNTQLFPSGLVHQRGVTPLSKLIGWST